MEKFSAARRTEATGRLMLDRDCDSCSTAACPQEDARLAAGFLSVTWISSSLLPFS